MSSLMRPFLALMILGGFCSTTRAVDLYVLSNTSFIAGGASTDFGRIDTLTGTYTSIANLTGSIFNLAWNPAAGSFFVTEEPTAINVSLMTLSTTGTLSNSLGSIGRSIYGMAYRTADSKLYAYDYNGDDTGTINTANGAWTMLNSNPGVTSTSPVGGRYSIMNDIMYLAGNLSSAGRFGTMGYTASSTFQQITTNSLYDNIVLANDGTTMYGVFGNGSAGQQRLYTIDVATGALTAGPLITGAGLGTYFHGAATILPEPSTYALGAIASLTMAWLARRRTRRTA